MGWVAGLMQADLGVFASPPEHMDSLAAVLATLSAFITAPAIVPAGIERDLGLPAWKLQQRRFCIARVESVNVLISA